MKAADKKPSINKRWFRSLKEAKEQVNRRRKDERVYKVRRRGQFYVGSYFEWLNLNS